MRPRSVSLSCELREITRALEAACELWETVSAPPRADEAVRRTIGLRALLRLLVERLRLVSRATESEVDPRLLAAGFNEAPPPGERDGRSPDVVLESWPDVRSAKGGRGRRGTGQ